MTLIKSILLGSAAGLVAVASAQAADLPTRKAAPVESDIHQMTALSLLRVRPSRDFDKNKMSLRLDSGL